MLIQHSWIIPMEQKPIKTKFFKFFPQEHNHKTLTQKSHENLINLWKSISTKHGQSLTIMGLILLTKKIIEISSKQQQGLTAKERQRGRRIFLTTLFMPKALPSYKDQFPFQAFLLILYKSPTKLDLSLLT